MMSQYGLNERVIKTDKYFEFYCILILPGQVTQRKSWAIENLETVLSRFGN